MIDVGAARILLGTEATGIPDVEIQAVVDLLVPLGHAVVGAAFSVVDRAESSSSSSSSSSSRCEICEVVSTRERPVRFSMSDGQELCRRCRRRLQNGVAQALERAA